MEKIFVSHSEADTNALAERLAEISVQGDIWALNGTLGVGKSVFARAFIKKLTGAHEVPSPTFTLLQTYSAKAFDIYHYDLYRLEKPSEIFELGVEEAFYSGVSLVEWPERMASFSPRNMWQVKIEMVPEGRKITISTNDADKEKRLENV